VTRSLQLQIGILALVFILLYLGLTPFSFYPQNRVNRIASGPGLAFEGRGLIYSEGPVIWDEAARHGLSIHLLLEPGLDSAGGFGALLSIDDGESQPPLVIAQWKDWLIVRVRKPKDEGRRSYWEIGAEGALITSEPSLVSIVSNLKLGTQIFVDGELGHQSVRPIAQVDGHFGGRLIFGSLRDGSGGWTGMLRGLSIYGEALDAVEVAADAARVTAEGFAALDQRPSELAFYAFDEGNRNFAVNRSKSSQAGQLVIPEVFAPLAPRILDFPAQRALRAGWFIRDGLKNLLGFIPLGFLVVLLLIERDQIGDRTAVGLALLLGGCLSLGIELVQILLPMRNSSFVDLILNVFGTGLGAVAALWLTRLVPRSGARRQPTL